MGRGERDRKRVKEGVIKVIFKIKTLLPLMNTSWDTNFQEKVMPHPLPPCMKFYMQFPLAGKQFDIHGHCEPWLSGLQTHSAQNAPTSGTEKKRSNSHKTLPSVVPPKKKKITHWTLNHHPSPKPSFVSLWINKENFLLLTLLGNSDFPPICFPGGSFSCLT